MAHSGQHSSAGSWCTHVVAASIALLAACGASKSVDRGSTSTSTPPLTTDTTSTTTTAPDTTSTAVITSTSSVVATTAKPVSTSTSSPPTTAPREDCGGGADPAKVLHQGCFGYGVGLLQWTLVAKGFGPIAIDRDFGKQTDGALRAFESRCKACVVDGRIDPQGGEWAQLEALPTVAIPEHSP